MATMLRLGRRLFHQENDFNPLNAMATSTIPLPADLGPNVQGLGQTVSAAPNSTCETCGNSYDKAFQVTMNGRTHVFDCFECAIQTLAPTCEHCRCRIIGHGVEENGCYYCCAHCAHHEGARQVADRA